MHDNLAAFVCGLDGVGAGAVRFADGLVITPEIHYDKTTLTGRPFYYFAYGAACTCNGGECVAGTGGSWQVKTHCGKRC